MKKFFFWFLVTFTLLFAYSQKEILISRFNYLLTSPCGTPISYRIGQVDQGYNLTEAEFQDRVGKVATIWNQAIGKNIFVYQPQAPLTVNLIYSERQSALDDLEKFQGELKSGIKSLESSITEYKSLSADFRSRLNAFNSEVASWMAQGGAPPDVYERLIRQQNDLKAEAERLNSLAQNLNQSVQDYNVSVGQFNQGVQSYNQVVTEKPEAGIYDGSVPKIDIYLTVSDEELIHTLAHEFGHVLEIEHLSSNPMAIMYPYSSEAVKLSSEDKTALDGVCSEIRGVKFLKEQLAELQSRFY